MKARGALGASNLERALGWAGKAAARVHASRVVLVSDGLATAGTAERNRLVAAAKRLGDAGVERLDAIPASRVSDAGVLRALVSGTLAHNGVVVTDTNDPKEIATRLHLPTVAALDVDVPGARWVWPRKLVGVQAGEERFVYADVPDATPARVVVGGRSTTAFLDHSPVARRAVSKARVDALVDRAERDGWTDAGRAEVVALAQKERIPSPLTALLVLESEANRQALAVRRGLVARPSGARSAGRRFVLPVTHRTRPPQIRTGTTRVNGRIPQSRSGPSSARTWAASAAATPKGCSGTRSSAAGSSPISFWRATEAWRRRSTPAPTSRTRASSPASSMRSSSFTSPSRSARRSPSAIRFCSAQGMSRSAIPRRPRPTSRHRTSPLRSRSSSGGREGRQSPRRRNPWTGVYAETRGALAESDAARALSVAAEGHARHVNDVGALLALGEAFEAVKMPGQAARAYGSIADVYPHRADMLRVAGGRLAALGGSSLSLAIDLLRRARDNRPDQPSSHQLLAMAWLAAGQYAETLATLDAAAELPFPARYVGVARLFREERAFVEALQRGGERPAVAPSVAAALLDTPATLVVATWESDASDVAITAVDAEGELLGPVTISSSDGFGPNASLLMNPSPGLRIGVRLERRGPTGDAFGLVHVLTHDGNGHVGLRTRPFALMTERATVSL